tara:strand:+ start:482 stop:1006 length:525 start_codon:yes stop_codon:yes gene_type:complete
MASLGGKGLTPDQLKKVLQLADKEGITITNTIKGRNNLDMLRKRLGFKHGGLMKYRDGKTVEADPTYEAMIKRNNKKTEKKKTKTKRKPLLSKGTIVKRPDPNKPRPSYFDVREVGDSPTASAIFTLAANLGAFDKEDKVTQPYEAKVKKFRRGKSVEVEMNRGNTTKNFKGSF